MIKNYFKVAIRNIVRHRSFTLLNVLGLAIGMAACMLLFLVVRYELSYDQFLPTHHSVYHVVTQDKTADGIDYTPGIPFPALEAIRIDFPEVVTGALQSSYGSQITVLGDAANTKNGKKFIEEEGVFFADPEFFKIFPYPFLTGSAAVLRAPNVTLLTKKMAEKYFGNWKDATGKYLRLDNAVTVKVGGVLEDVPANTDFPLAVMTSLITSKNNPAIYNYSKDWGSTTSNFQVFMLLPERASVAGINSRFLQFSKKNYQKGGQDERTNFLQPLAEVHFDKRFGNFGDHVTSRSTLWTLSLIGIFIIIMACINFINLSTAQAITRSKEIGIRKVLGGRKSNLFWQMMGETAIIVIIALLLAFALAAAAAPFIQHVTSITERLPLFTPPLLLFSVAVALIVTVFSGYYPSLVLAGFRPMLALKNKITSASVGGISLRRGLVVLQFVISQVLIIGTLVAVSQMNFVHHADLGFNKDAVLVLNSTADSVVFSRQKAFKQELLGLNGVEALSFSSDVPSSEDNWGSNFAFDHKEDQNFTLYVKSADADYFKTFGLQFIAGHGYEESDTATGLVINATLTKKLGLRNPVEAIGKDLRTGRGLWKPVIGVVRDFKTNSLREETKPTMISSRQRFYSDASIKMRSGNLAVTRAAIQRVWDKYYPEYANRAFFMDESVEGFYSQENQLSLLYKIFSVIAVLISCLGLYGLVSFMAVQRTKEVGVRKVLGASAGQIVYLFSKEFTLLILVASLLAAPVAWYMMKEWLDNFAYRVPLGAGVFLVAILASVMIAWITVGYKSIRAAMANPVKSLRTE